MGLDVLGKFPLLFTRETFFRTHVWFPAQQCSSEKGSSLKEKNLLTRRANSFLVEKTPFQKGGKTTLKELPPLKSNRFLISYNDTSICFHKKLGLRLAHKRRTRLFVKAYTWLKH